MFWGDRITKEIQDKYKDAIEKGVPLVIRDEKTASGRVHVGSMRGVAIHGIVDEILTEKGVKHSFLYEINDYDPMDGLPVYLDQNKFKEHMGKPLCNVPSPDPAFKNYAEYFGQEFEKVITETGFNPTFYRSSDLYKEGKFNEAIKLALTHADKVREIYKRISGSVRPDDWLPLNVVCEICGKVGTTKARNFDGQTVEYTCGKFVDWADGCGKQGRIDPYDGRAKLPWKVEWAAKFMVLGVHVEGGGKDHSTKGGAREVAEAISLEVFNTEPPLNIPYEFFQVGGKKMSSSKGAGSSSREIADLLPPDIFRMLLIQKEPSKVLEFDPQGDTVPILFDNYDSYAKKYFEKVEDDFARIFYLSHKPEERNTITERHLPRFSTVAFISQMPHLDPASEIEKLQEIKLTDDDKKELDHRITYVRKWIKDYAPEEYRFEVHEDIVPEAAKRLSDEQKRAFKIVIKYFEHQPPQMSGDATDPAGGQAIHSFLHLVKETEKIDPKDLFSAIYLSILGKPSGPKAGWFLSVLPRDFLIKRFYEVI